MLRVVLFFPLCNKTCLEDPDESCVFLVLIMPNKKKKSDPNNLRPFGIRFPGNPFEMARRSPLPLSGSFVVELRGDPGQSPFQVGEHELERFGPLLLRVELGFDGVRAAAAARVLDLPFLHVHPRGSRQRSGSLHRFCRPKQRKSPVREAESSVSFLHLLLELLDAVQKGHHGVVEFVVPEKPQASRTVQRQLLKKSVREGQEGGAITNVRKERPVM